MMNFPVTERPEFNKEDRETFEEEQTQTSRNDSDLLIKDERKS